MFANNEIGTIQPISEIGSFCRAEGIVFHTDAVQAMGTMEIDVDKMNIDLLSMSAHKFNGPKGIGVLYIRTGVKIDRFMTGGEQERGKRAGTLATPLIVGMASALKETLENREVNNEKMIRLRDDFINGVQKNIPYVHLNGDRAKRLANNINFSFEFIEGESLLMRLDLDGIAVSSGSACASGSLQASHVIKAIGVSDELAHSTIRFSLGKDTTQEQMNHTLEVLIKNVKVLREMSPLYDSKKKEGKYV
jgi:cysteine desulfurase